MITKEKFIKIINKYQEFQNNLDKFSDLFNGGWDSPLFNFSEEIFDEYLKDVFNTHQYDWVAWWLWEARNYTVIDNDVEKNIEDINDLWDFIKDLE